MDAAPIPPPIQPPPIQPRKEKPKLEWYQHVWLGLPIALVAIGGAIGGACGGAAWALNHTIFQKTKHPVLRYVWTGLISATAVVGYLLFATFVMALLHKSK